MASIKLENISLNSKDLCQSCENKSEVSNKEIILKNINFEIAEGETLALLGPTGCGKTSLLKLVAGLLKPTQGHIFFNDQNFTDLKPKERNIGMVFQNYALYPQFNSKGNLSFKFWIKKTPSSEIEERIDETSKLLGLDFKKLLYRMPKTLSMGEKQKVALGRCIIGTPSILLFDEPLSNLDAQVRLKTKVALKKLLLKFSITTLYVTHDQQEAFTLADKIVLMNENGEIEQIGSFYDLYNNPISRMVAEFIGSPGMNIFKPQEFGYDKKDFPFFGIHPEDILFTKIKESDKKLTGRIKEIQNLGYEKLFFVDVNDKKLVVKEKKKTEYKINQEITIFLPEEKLHYFKK